MLCTGFPCTAAWSCALVPHWTGGLVGSTMVRCCSSSVSYDSSSVGMDWGVLDFRLANWFLSC